ncbi:CBS domain-containing protein, partial [Candidatus Woesearchaeota archaeon]
MITINEIKKLRKKLGLTQGELAKQAGVSQSLIAKIEAGSIDPTYSKATAIINTLKSLRTSKEITAKKIMIKNVVFVCPEDPIKKAIQKMKKYAISQMPVLDDKRVVGMISEKSILNSILKESSSNMKVNDVMFDPPPIVNEKTPLSVLSDLLK